MVKRYKRLTYIFPNAIEVYEYLDGKYGARGAPRENKKKATKEEIKKRNQWNKEKKARNKLRTWFKENDYWVTYTYRKEDRPSGMKMAIGQIMKALRKIRTEYKKRGYELRWMRNIEVGTKGAWHIHMVINRIPDSDLILTKAWNYGGTHFKLLYEKGGFADLAAYITKTPDTDSRLKESKYSTSRNIPATEPIPERFVRWIKKPRVKKGYELDKDSYFEGTNDFTGYKYRYYTAFKTEIHRRI